MYIKDYLTSTELISVQKLSEAVKNLGSSDKPVVSIAVLKRELCTANAMWKDFITPTVVNGRRSDRMMLTSAKNTTLDGYLNKISGFLRDYSNRTKSHWIPYDYTYFRKICYMETAMLIWKYESYLSVQELEVALLMVLVRYFMLCTERVDGNSDSLLYKPGDFEKIFEEIMNTPCDALKDYYDMIDYGYMPQIRNNQDITEKDYFLEMLESGATKSELIKEYMRIHNCSRRTAYRRLKEIGLTRDYKFKNNLK